MNTASINTTDDAQRCPLCGEANHCRLAASGHIDSDCWCRDTHIPKEQLRRASRISSQRCICMRCALELGKETAL